MVAYSKDGTQIVTARQHDDVATILDTLPSAPQGFIDANIQIRDLRVIDDTACVADIHWLVSRHLAAGGTEQGARDADRVAVDLSTRARGGDVEQAALSSDCSQIAFTTGETAFLYDAGASSRMKGTLTLGECKGTWVGYRFELDLFAGTELQSVCKNKHAIRLRILERYLQVLVQGS